jgi:hypothetical protein
MLPCHAERRLSIDLDGSVTALIFYDWKGAYHHVFLHTKHMRKVSDLARAAEPTRIYKVCTSLYELVQAQKRFVQVY